MAIQFDYTGSNYGIDFPTAYAIIDSAYVTPITVCYHVSIYSSASAFTDHSMPIGSAVYYVEVADLTDPTFTGLYQNLLTQPLMAGGILID